MAGQILQAMGTPTGFKVQIGITSALAICCIPLVWFYMVRCRELAQRDRLERDGLFALFICRTSAHTEEREDQVCRHGSVA